MILFSVSKKGISFVVQTFVFAGILGGMAVSVEAQTSADSNSLSLSAASSTSTSSSSGSSSSSLLGAQTLTQADSQTSEGDTALMQSSASLTRPWFAKEKFGLSYFNFTSSDKTRVDYGHASWNIYQYFSFIYKLNKEERFSLRTAFNSQTEGNVDTRGNSRAGDTQLSDLHMTYSNYSITSFPGEWDLSGTFYMYFPTSESSQQKKWNTRLASWMILEKKINTRWTTTYNFKPDLYVQSQTAYRSEKEKFNKDGNVYTEISAENNQIGKLDHYMELTYFVNKTFTPLLDVGFVHEWYHTSDYADRKRPLQESLKVAPGTWITLTNYLKFIAAIENKPSVDVSRLGNNSFQLFRPEETQYYVMTFWTLL